jgi:hypothetical protein
MRDFIALQKLLYQSRLPDLTRSQQDLDEFAFFAQPGGDCLKNLAPEFM